MVIDVQAPQPPNQIFVVGMNGSGTTMVRDHLANHSWIYGYPAETRSLPYFILNQHEYRDLDAEGGSRRLWRDMKASLAKRGNLVFEGIQLPPLEGRSAAGCFDHIMQYLANAEGKRIWCEKTPMYVRHISLLADAFPKAKFVHIIRDGRACAASFHRRWRFNPVRTICRWKMAVTAGRQQGMQLGSRYREIRYEDFTVAPDVAFKELLKFLEIPYESNVLTSTRPSTGSTVSPDGTVFRNTRKADAYFTRAVVDRMEAVAGQLLTELGYPCSNVSGDYGPPSWRLRWWRITDDLRRFAMVAVKGGRLLRPSKWRYIATRTRSALKQRETERL